MVLVIQLKGVLRIVILDSPFVVRFAGIGNETGGGRKSSMADKYLNRESISQLKGMP